MLRRDTAKEASTDGIGCVGWIPMVLGCAANPPCYNAVVGSLVSMERLHIDSGGCGFNVQNVCGGLGCGWR